MNIFIVGYRCTGKTSVAKALSDLMGWQFVDADKVLMAKTGESVSQIVGRGGWPLFRELEKQTLKGICRGEGQVVATGGGVVLDDENIDAMRASGPVIWLRATPETIHDRMVKDVQTETLRPSLTNQELFVEITQTLGQRTPRYRKAMTWSLDTDGRSVSELAGEIVSLLKENEPPIVPVP